MRSLRVRVGSAALLGVALAVPLAMPTGAVADAEDVAVLTGIVTLGGSPLEGATVLAHGGVDAMATTDADGRYRLEVPADTYTVCAGMIDGSAHHSCTPGDPVGPLQPDWVLGAGQEKTADFVLATSSVPLSSTPPTSAVWKRDTSGVFNLVYTGRSYYRPAKGPDVDVTSALRSVRVFGQETSTSPLFVDKLTLHFAEYPFWYAVAPVSEAPSFPVVRGGANQCGEYVPPRTSSELGITYSIPRVIHELTDDVTGTKLATQVAPSNVVACRRQVRVRVGAIPAGRRKEILVRAASANWPNVNYRPVVRIYARGRLIGTRRVQYGEAVFRVPRSIRSKTVRIRVVVATFDGSPAVTVRKTLRLRR